MKSINKEKNSVLHRIKEPVPYIIISLIFAILGGSILMILVYRIPVQPIRQHVKDNLKIYSSEGDGFRWAPPLDCTLVDTFTDSIILNSAAFIGTGSRLKDAMNNPWVQFEGTDSETENLIFAMKDDQHYGGDVHNYTQCWHGYLIFIKPLLCLFNPSELRVLIGLLQYLAMMMVLIRLSAAAGRLQALAYGMTFLVMNPISLALSIQFADICFITLAGSWYLLCSDRPRDADNWKVFLWIGVATSYFDFLTYPLATLGINLLLVLMLQPDRPFLQYFRLILQNSAAWVIGYGCMWVGKWLVATLITGNNIFLSGFNAVLNRTGGTVPDGVGIDVRSPFQVYKPVLKALLCRPVIFILLLALVCFAFYCVRRRVKLYFPWPRLAAYLTVGLFPFLWYSVLRNHSAIHAWMTYRTLGITVFAAGLCIAASVQIPRKQPEIGAHQ